MNSDLHYRSLRRLNRPYLHCDDIGSFPRFGGERVSNCDDDDFATSPSCELSPARSRACRGRMNLFLGCPPTRAKCRVTAVREGEREEGLEGCTDTELRARK